MSSHQSSSSSMSSFDQLYREICSILENRSQRIAFPTVIYFRTIICAYNNIINHNPTIDEPLHNMCVKSFGQNHQFYVALRFYAISNIIMVITRSRYILLNNISIDYNQSMLCCCCCCSIGTYRKGKARVWKCTIRFRWWWYLMIPDMWPYD